MHAKVNWVGVEKMGEKRILDALSLALQGVSIPEIARKTGIPTQSLCDVRKHGPYSHRDREPVSAARGENDPI